MVNKDIFTEVPKIINIGLKKFSDELEDQDLEVVQIDWSPPAGGDQDMINLLDDLM